MRAHGCLLTAIAFALYGGSAVAQKTPQFEHLQDDLRVTELMDDTVITDDGNEIGQIHNVMIATSGQLDTLIVQAYDGAWYELSADDIKIYPLSNTVLLDRTSDQLVSLEFEAHPAAQRRGSKGVGLLLDSPVDLDGQAPYEQVADVLLDSGNYRISAYVLESDSGKSHILPANWKLPDHASGVVQFPLSVPQLIAMEWMQAEPDDERVAASVPAD